MDELSAPRYIMPMIVSNCEHSDKQQFQTLSCVVPTLHDFLSSRKLHLYIRALLLDNILALKKQSVRLGYILLMIECYFRQFLSREGFPKK